jgi:hypothetical protein
MNFTDVDEFNPFFIYIRCLYCRDIISGYNTGCTTGNPCFKPFNNVTRGQMSKIVANSAGLSQTPTGQQYTDVPTTHPFYVWIWRLTDAGHVSGYNTGCSTGNPCFKPEANVTRAQLAKIVSNAAGFTDVPPPGSFLFTDVPPTHTFYLFVERLARRGIVEGYECGEPPAGPCDPQGRPWFLPQDDVTRGQATKFVSNTFFPIECAPGRPGLIMPVGTQTNN